MPVLLLSRGDTQGKDLLRRAIEARYGFSPPALETLQLMLSGRIHSRLGPVSTWLAFDATLRLRFPLALRQDYRLRFLGLPVRTGLEVFDGMVYRVNDEVITDSRLVASMQRRAWAFSALVLTPLAEQYVEILYVDDSTIEVINTETDDKAVINLNDDHTVNRITVTTINPNTGGEATYTLMLAAEQADIGDLIFPTKITVAWDDVPFAEVEPVSTTANPDLPDDFFGGSED